MVVAQDLISVDSNEARQTAEDILRLILKNDSLSTEAMSVLAILFEITGRSSESAELYQRIIELNPENLIAINNLAWILSEHRGQFQQALELAQQGLKLDPNYIDLIETRGVVYYRLGEYNNAIHDLTKCIELYPDSTPQSVTARFHLARVLAELGKKDEALKNLKHALDQHEKIGGLSNKELTEAQRLLQKLEEGS